MTITLHFVADNSDPKKIDRGIDYIVNTHQPQATVAGGSQIDVAMNIVEKIHARAPHCSIFWRVLEDTGSIFKMTSNQWWSNVVFPRLKFMQEHNLVMVVDNESSGDDAIIMRYAAESIIRGNMLHAASLYGAFCRFATGNIGDGSQPGQSNQYPLLKPLLEKLDARDWVSPNEYTNLPGKSSAGHLERYKRILAVVPTKHFNVSIGECGVLNDYRPRDGYVGKITDAQMAAQLLADEIWYYGGKISRHLFCRGGYQEWDTLQVGDGALEFLEDYYAKNPIGTPEPPIVIPPPPPVITPPYTPPPFTPGDRYLMTAPGDFINVRITPATLAAKIGEIPNKSVITVFEESLVSGEYWRKVHFGESIGWISLQKGAVKFAPYLPSAVNISIDLLKDIMNSLKLSADETRRQSLALAVTSDNTLKDYLMVKAILDNIGGGT